MSSSRIRQARLAQGLSLQQSADRLAGLGLSITRAALHKHETGASSPTAKVLMRLAALYSVPADELLHEVALQVEWLAFRKHSRLPARLADRAKAIATQRAEHHLRLASTLRQPTPRFPKRQPVATLADAEQLAVSVRKLWGLGEGPVVSLAQTIEDHGGVVVEVVDAPPQFDGLSGLANGCHPIVVVNHDAPADRRRYTLAHELGHIVMTCDGIPAKEQEPLAHRFAAAFLVPGSVARRELGNKRRDLDLEELKILKQRYGVSIQALIRRAYDLSIVTRATYTRLCKRVSALGWRRIEPGTYDAESRPAKFRQLILHGQAEGVLSRAEAGVLMVRERARCESLGSPALAVKLLTASEQERDSALSSAAAELTSEYAKDGALRGFDAFGEKDLPSDPSDE